MPADALRLDEPTDCSVEVDFASGCPNPPIAVDHSPRVVLHLATDIFIEALRFLSRRELEKMLLVSRRWSHAIGGAEDTLQQRRRFFVFTEFYGKSPGMISVHFRKVRSGQWRIVRVLTTRGLLQALSAVRSHPRNALVKSVVLFFPDRVPPPGPPREMRVDIPLPVSIDTSRLRVTLLSLQSLKLHLFVSSGVDPQDAILTLPAQIIRDFVTLNDVNIFAAEFSLYLKKPDNVAFAYMPDVDDATDRRKRFRCHLNGEDTVVRVSVYENPAARECLTVVTFDYYRRTVVFFNGNKSVAELKQVFHRTYDLY